MNQPRETHLTLADKLRAIGYLPPSGIQQSSDEAHDHALRRCGISNCAEMVAPPATLCEKCDGETEAMQRYLDAQAAYLRELARRPSLWSRLGDAWSFFRTAIWPRISHAAISMAIVLVTAIALIVGCAVTARTSEVPAWVIRGIAAVETGTDWRDIGDVRGTWSHGSIGEAGPWQLSPAVLRDLRAYDRRHRVHDDVVLAESLTRAWLLRLHRTTGSWDATVAAYHAGLGRRTAPFAIAYAERVRAVGALR